jgi:DNA-binding CsgD family transcriptional regulator
VKVSQFTKRELYHFQAFCNFTPDEEKLFQLRSAGKTLEECAEFMNVSDSTAKRIQKRVTRKIETEQRQMTLS